jgi:hypothetical protein
VRVNTKGQDFSVSITPHQSAAVSYKDDIIAHSRGMYSASNVPPTPTEPTEQVPKQPPAPEPPPPRSAPVADTPVQEVRVQEVREHRYLQMFVKKTAEEHGYKANIEVPTPDRTGQVDVLLEKERRTVAVEISVSTTAAWELHNVEKCLAAGYTSIVVCSSNARHLAQIRKKVEGACTMQQCAKITFATPEDVQALLSDPAPHAPIATVVKGYRVKVQYSQSGGDNKQEILQRILNTGKK